MRDVLYWLQLNGNRVTAIMVSEGGMTDRRSCRCIYGSTYLRQDQLAMSLLVPKLLNAIILPEPWYGVATSSCHAGTMVVSEMPSVLIWMKLFV